MLNTWIFTETRVKWELLQEFTGNVFEFVNQRPYRDKKGILPDGVTVTLHIVQDAGDYGIDKKTGKPRQTNLGQNFDATILCGKQELPFETGDLVSLEGFDYEHSMAIGFDLLLRFKNIRKLEDA